jgi:hypothetical protein
MKAVAGSFIQTPPVGGLVKAAAAIGPGGWRMLTKTTKLTQKEK